MVLTQIVHFSVKMIPDFDENINTSLCIFESLRQFNLHDASSYFCWRVHIQFFIFQKMNVSPQWKSYV